MVLTDQYPMKYLMFLCLFIVPTVFSQELDSLKLERELLNKKKEVNEWDINHQQKILNETEEINRNSQLERINLENLITNNSKYILQVSEEAQVLLSSTLASKENASKKTNFYRCVIKKLEKDGFVETSSCNDDHSVSFTKDEEKK